MVRSRSAIITVGALGMVSGCDLVFDVNTTPEACELGSFAESTPVELVTAEAFSFDWDMTYGVVMQTGTAHEIDLTTNELTSIELGPYQSSGLALTPEGNALFYTSMIEPPILRGALRGGIVDGVRDWKLDATVPRGTFAGTPSADVFGPRRLLVKMRPTDDVVTEFEDVNGRWMPIGEPHPTTSIVAPNLTPNGLTVVYASTDAAGTSGVFAAQRPSRNEWFGEPQMILPGASSAVQLLGECKTLYSSDGTMLRRYDR